MLGSLGKLNLGLLFGDEEYAHLQTLFLNVFAGVSCFCCLRRTPLGNINFAWGELCGEC